MRKDVMKCEQLAFRPFDCFTEYSEGLEVGVAQLSEENARLRARLAELVATRSNVIPPDLSIPPNPPSTKPLDAGVDYNYLSKIQTEIHAAKVLLLEREIQVAKLRLDDPSLGSEDEDLNTARTGLLRQFTKHLYLQAEAGALETMINQVRTEKEEISRQADVIRRDIEHRKAFSDPSLQVQPPDSSDIDGGMGVGVGVGMSGIGHEEVLGDHEEVIGDRSMMDIGGWVDAAWQVSLCLCKREPSLIPGIRTSRCRNGQMNKVHICRV